MADQQLAEAKAVIARWAACKCCDHRAPTDPCKCPPDVGRVLTPKERAELRKKRK